MKLFLRSILFFALASFAPQAFGQIVAWTNTGPDNNFNNGLNWTTPLSTGTVPGSGDLVFILNGFTTVADPTIPIINAIQGGAATITINSSTNQSLAGLAISSNFEATTVANGVLNLNFTGGSTLTIGTQGMAIVGSVTVNYTGNLQMADGTLQVGGSPSIIDAPQITGPGTLKLGAGSVNLDSATSTSFIIGQGTTGTVTQNAGSIVTTGQVLTIGGAAGTGTYTASAGSVLNIGTPVTPQSASYQVNVGAAAGSVGTLNISGAMSALNPNTTIQVGGDGTGTLQQSGAVSLGGAGSSLLVSDNGNYNLMSGALAIGANNVDAVTVDIDGAAAAATLTQTGGTLTAGAATTVTIGDAGIGNYNLSGASSGLSAVTADFQNGFTLGNQTGSVGTVTQSGGALTAENIVTVGAAGTGIYNMAGGTATFSAGVAVGATGSINQTGGTFIIPTGQTLDLSTGGSSYTLGGGTLQVGSGTFIGQTTGEGMLNFAGGTLQNSGGGTLTDPLDGTVTGISTLDTTNGDITLSGTLADGGGGSGTLKVIGGGNVNLTGPDNTASWGVNIVNGAVFADAALFPSAGAMAIGSAGTFNLTVAAGGTQKLAGNVTGSGIFNVTFGGTGDTLELAGPANNFTGTTNLNGGGTLQIFNGTWGNINGAGAGLTIGGDAAVADAGTVNLTGINTYTGPTTVNAGFKLTAADTIVGGVTTNDAFNGAVVNHGTLASTTPLPAVLNTPTLTINGTLNSDGTLMVRTNGIAADQYKVTGAATLSGNVLVVNGSGTGTYTIVSAASQTGGDTLTVNAPTTLFSATLTTTANTVILNTVQQPLSGFTATPNQQAVATALDPLTQTPPAGFAPVLGALNNLSAGAIPGALESLTPESLQYARMISFENTSFLVQRMNGVDADLRAGFGGLDTSAMSIVAPGFNTGMGRSLGSLLASNSPSYHQAAPNGVNYYPGGGDNTSTASPASTPPWNSSSQVISDSPNPYMADQHPSGPQAPAFSEFISGDAVLADLNQDLGAANAPSSKAHYTAGDVTAGVSYRMTSHLAAGVLFNYNHTDAKTDSSGSKTNVDSYSPGLFATYFDHGFYANGLFAFGYNTYSNSRDIGFLGETASSHPDGQQYVGALDLGYDFHPDKQWVFGPTLGITYTHLNIDSFTESGAPGADLNVDSQSADSLRSRLGGHVIFQTNTGDVLLQPNLTAMWQHEYLDNASGITSSFNDFSASSFTIDTVAPSRDSALLGVGLTATLNTSMTLYLNYMADVGASNYFAQSVVGGFKARF